MSDNIEFNKSQRQAWLSGLDFEVFAEAVIEQMNSLRMQKVNLVQDMDNIVNDYMQVCKKYPIIINDSALKFIQKDMLLSFLRPVLLAIINKYPKLSY